MLNDNELYTVLIEPELYWTFPSIWMTFGLLWDPSHSVKCAAFTLIKSALELYTLYNVCNHYVYYIRINL